MTECKSYCSQMGDYRCCRDCGRQFEDCSCNRCPAECGHTKTNKKNIWKGKTVKMFRKMLKFILIKYHDKDMEKMTNIEGKKSDWIDLRAQEKVVLRKGEYYLIPLGISMQLPEDYEAHVLPRSSTFKKWGIIMTNSMGIIDNSYNGDNDIWHFPAYATRDAVIEKGVRIAQFRIMRKQETIKFIEVDELGNSDRGGIGSTGTN